MFADSIPRIGDLEHRYKVRGRDISVAAKDYSGSATAIDVLARVFGVRARVLPSSGTALGDWAMKEVAAEAKRAKGKRGVHGDQSRWPLRPLQDLPGQAISDFLARDAAERRRGFRLQSNRGQRRVPTEQKRVATRREIQPHDAERAMALSDQMLSNQLTSHSVVHVDSVDRQ